jgi:hypothetical protein
MSRDVLFPRFQDEQPVKSGEGYQTVFIAQPRPWMDAVELFMVLNPKSCGRIGRSEDQRGHWSGLEHTVSQKQTGTHTIVSPFNGHNAVWRDRVIWHAWQEERAQPRKYAQEVILENKGYGGKMHGVLAVLVESDYVPLSLSSSEKSLSEARMPLVRVVWKDDRQNWAEPATPGQPNDKLDFYFMVLNEIARRPAESFDQSA